MLGRQVGDQLSREPERPLFSDDVVAITRGADLFLLNLECAISDRGERWPDPRKPFFFRAPPRAIDVLRNLGVDGVTLANNHLLDYVRTALLDTIDHLDEADIAHTGAGKDTRTARAPMMLRHRDHTGATTVGVVGLTDHPADFAATTDRPGVAFADLWRGVPSWVTGTISGLGADPSIDIVVAMPHWGPNMVAAPRPHVVTAAKEFVAAGATLVAGHSAHVFHGVSGPVMFDLGDFIDDYAINEVLRNDLGLVFVVEFDGAHPMRIEAAPLELDYCRTELASGPARDWIAERFARACADFGTFVHDRGDRLVIDLGAETAAAAPPR